MKLAFRPLPLFATDNLRTCLASSAAFLRWSFLALVLLFSSHPLYNGKEAENAEYYANSAYDAITPLTTEGVAKIEIVQSLCMLALRDLKGMEFC
jgi:hypothetical protein